MKMLRDICIKWWLHCTLNVPSSSSGNRLELGFYGTLSFIKLKLAYSLMSCLSLDGHPSLKKVMTISFSTKTFT